MFVLKVEVIGVGGFSGQFVKVCVIEVICYLVQCSNGVFKIIGVGGISSFEDVIEKLDVGVDFI